MINTLLCPKSTTKEQKMKKSLVFVVAISVLVAGCAAPDFAAMYKDYKAKENADVLYWASPPIVVSEPVSTNEHPISVMRGEEEVKLKVTPPSGPIWENSDKVYSSSDFRQMCEDWDLKDFSGQLKHSLTTLRALVRACEQGMQEIPYFCFHSSLSEQMTEKCAKQFLRFHGHIKQIKLFRTHSVCVYCEIEEIIIRFWVNFDDEDDQIKICSMTDGGILSIDRHPERLIHRSQGLSSQAFYQNLETPFDVLTLMFVASHQNEPRWFYYALSEKMKEEYAYWKFRLAWGNIRSFRNYDLMELCQHGCVYVEDINHGKCVIIEYTYRHQGNVCRGRFTLVYETDKEGYTGWKIDKYE